MELTGLAGTALYSATVARPAGGVPAAAPVHNLHSAPQPPAVQPVSPPAPRLAEPAVAADGKHLDSDQKASASGDDKASKTERFSPEELREIDHLEARDKEVRDHERAHASVGGQYTGAPNLEYTRGPDGRLYATSGEVSVDTSAVSGDPQATIDKMRIVIRAAMAPAEPSSQDHRVAARAQALLAEAQAELAAQSDTEEKETDETSAVDGAQTGLKSEGGKETDAPGVRETASVQESTSLPDTRLRSGVPFISSHLEMERRLVETGVFTKVFPEGSLIRQQA
jgi:hypothetical protein